MKTPEQIATEVTGARDWGHNGLETTVWVTVRDAIKADRAQRAEGTVTIEPPATIETPEGIAERVADAATYDWDEAYDVALPAVHAGIQAAWASWKPETAPGLTNSMIADMVRQIRDQSGDWRATADHLIEALED